MSAVATGIILPCFSLLIGDLAEAFDPRNSADHKREEITRISGLMAVLAFATWITGYIYFAFWQVIAENISYDLRMRYLKSIII